MSDDLNRNIIQEDEIDLLELARIIWSKRYFILKVTGVFFAFGFLIAFTSRIEYEASCSLMPESQGGSNNSLRGLGGLAGLAGIDLGLGATGSLTPELYPEIVKSIPFQLDLINEPVRFSNIDSTVSSYTYFMEFDSPSLVGLIKSYTVGLPGKVKSIFSSNKEILSKSNKDEFIYLSKEEWELIKSYKERINISVDNQTGIISVTVLMPDAYASAKIADMLVRKLTAEVTNYKIEKVKVNLEFIKERYKEAENEYKMKQKQVALFSDQNKNITSSLVQTEYQRLQNELGISLEVYKGLATQLEQARIKVKEETPVFTILEPVRVPAERTKPKRKLILIASLFLGIVSSVTFTLIKNQFLNSNNEGNCSNL